VRKDRETFMSNNNKGTGFWVVAALIAALSIAAIVEAAISLVVRTCTKRRGPKRFA
jgi:hypothetical protein